MLNSRWFDFGAFPPKRITKLVDFISTHENDLVSCHKRVYSWWKRRYGTRNVNFQTWKILPRYTMNERHDESHWNSLGMFLWTVDMNRFNLWYHSSTRTQRNDFVSIWNCSLSTKTTCIEQNTHPPFVVIHFNRAKFILHGKWMDTNFRLNYFHGYSTHA